MSRIFRRGKHYYCWVPRPEGGTRRQATGCTDKEAARARAAELERIAVDPERAAAAQATLRQALELLIRDRTSKASAGKRSQETVGFYAKKSGVLLDGLAAVLKRSPKAHIMLSEVKASLYDEYVMQRREDGASESSIGKELTTWRSAMRLAKRRGLWTGDIEQVFEKGFSTEYKPGERFASPGELVKLFHAMVRPVEYRKHGVSDEQLVELRARFDAGENRKALAKSFSISTATLWKIGSQRDVGQGPVQGHDAFAIVAFAIATGAEPSAVWRARRSDAAPDRSKCLVRGSKNARRKDRPVPLPLLPFRLLLDFALRHGSGTGEFLLAASMRSNFGRRLQEACTRAGIPGLTLTDLRRTHGKWLRLSGVTPSAIGPSLGHADGRMAERVYGKASAEELSTVIEAQIAAGGRGLLMGDAPGDSGGSLGVSGDPEVSLFPANRSAQTRSRTADTGIFNPLSPLSNDAREADLRTSWAANGEADRVEPLEHVEPESVRGDASDRPEGLDRVPASAGARPGPASAGPRHGPRERGEAVLVTAQRGTAALAVEWDLLDGQLAKLDGEGGGS